MSDFKKLYENRLKEDRKHRWRMYAIWTIILSAVLFITIKPII